MFLQTKPTINFIHSVISFLTKSSLCLASTEMGFKNREPDLFEDAYNLKDFLKKHPIEGFYETEIDLLEDYYNKFSYSYNIEKTNRSFPPIEKFTYDLMDQISKNSLVLLKDLFELKKTFTKKKYKDYLKCEDTCVENFNRFIQENSSIIDGREIYIVSMFINDLKTTPEKAIKNFTGEWLDEKENKRRIDIIYKDTSSEPIKYRSMDKRFIICTVVALVIICILILALMFFKNS